MTWVFLAVAIVAEVGATLSLRMVSGRRWRWLSPTLGGYLIAFSALSLALQGGIPIGVAYGIWTACGVVLTAVAGRLLFREPFTGLMALGVAAIVGGVILIEVGSQLGSP
jgi:small multidrug resistance pump